MTLLEAPPFPPDDDTDLMEDAHNELLAALENYAEKARVCIRGGYYNPEYHGILLDRRQEVVEIEQKLLSVGSGWYKSERRKKN